jgi:dipeptidyl aminopeptidase/acylaminoacyl peptidase
VQTISHSSLWVAASGEADRGRKVYEDARGVAWMPDGRLAFESSGKIWITRQDGSELRELSQGVGNDRDPSVSPDGRSIVFVSDRSGNPRIWRMDIEGGNLKPLTNGQDDEWPALSPDGKWVLYTAGEGSRPSLRKVPLEGGASVEVVEGLSFTPGISPDGKFISYVVADEKLMRFRLAIAPFEGGPPLKILDSPSTTWAPDGRGFTGIDNRSGADNIWEWPMDGGKPRQLTHFKSDRISAYAYSRDGKQLALSRGTVSSDVVLIKNFR